MKDLLAQRLPYLGVAALVIALDRMTKELVAANLSPHHSIPIISGLFDLTYVRNPGGVFGIFKNLDDGVRGALFTIVPATAIILIASYSLRLPATKRLSQLSLMLILGGAVGNLIDRFLYGSVIDFLDVYWRQYHWPAFNVADSAICVGVGMLMLESLLSSEASRPRPEAAASPAVEHPQAEPSRRDAP